MPQSITKQDSIPGKVIRTSYDEEQNIPVFVVSQDEEGTMYLYAICDSGKVVRLMED